jgi:hypothetical protein
MDPGSHVGFQISAKNTNLVEDHPIFLSETTKPMGFTYPIPDRWRMCTISYSIQRWRTAPISCGQSTNTIILKSNEHKSYAWVFGVICTFQSNQFFDRLSMHFGVVDHIRASALTTADRRRRASSNSRVFRYKKLF